MIKKFGDFNIEDIKDGEREHFERELNARKKMRTERSEENDLNFQDIKSSIIKEISSGENYHISTGKRLIELDGIKEDEIHIEYESPELGRIRIFKPKDTSTMGYYEVNGKVFHEDGNMIRNFYHFLSLEIVGKEQVPVTENKIHRFDEFMKEGIKEVVLGALLFLASCTNVQVTNPVGRRIMTPAEMEIKGYVESETYLPGKGNYVQFITIKGDDGNTYKYKINSHPFLSKSYKINDKDSVRMVFDENGDSKIYKIKK